MISPDQSHANDNARLRVLHITNWYPGDANPYEAMWIRRQIQSLKPNCENYVLHIQVIHSSRLRWQKRSIPEGVQIVMEIPIHRWIVIEYLTYIILRSYLAKIKVNENFDVINFHIAYPLLVYWHKLKRFISIPVVINEHWSAYHYSFNVQKAHKLKRIRKIFSHHLPMIVVSKSLLSDVKSFAGTDNIEYHIVPNAVDISIFRCSASGPRDTSTFLMLSLWRSPKKPLVVIEAFGKFMNKKNLRHLQLNIGGYGPLIDEMRRCVASNNLHDHVTFLGRLNSREISERLNSSLAFVHCSDYETFSVVCAEALCCGTPVVASAVGGIRELVSEEDGFLVKENTVDAWVMAFDQFWLRRHTFDKADISRKAQENFSMQSVGERYFEAVRKVYEK